MNISVDNLSKLYGTQKAVDQISFEVKTGEIVGFLGPNGAGKTTTMKILTCYMQPSSGTVRLGNFNTRDHAQEIKKRIGYLPESNPLYTDMPVLEYLAFMAGLQQVPKSKIPGRIREMVIKCGLDAEKHKRIQELSKGYKQRVGIAQALIHDPEVLILDEPTTGLDPNQIVEIRKLIRELGKEKTVILSTHILPEVEATCDRILIINKGKIVADGDPATLRQQAQGKSVWKIRLEAPHSMESVVGVWRQISGVHDVEPPYEAGGLYQVQADPESHIAKAIFESCVANGWTLTELTPVEARLEDVFRDVTLN